MTSILTNVAAMSALQTLRSISSSMEETQARVSSGLRVGSASDNAAYWSIATTMRSDNMALSAVQDALGLGAAKVDTAYAGMNSSVEVVKEIKKKLVAATEDGVDKDKIQEEITQLQQQLVSISDAASFSGENWLKADVGTKTSVVASFVRDASGNVSVKKVDYDLDATTVLFDSTGGKQGILDRETAIDGNGVAVNVNIGGTTDTYNVIRYTTAEVIADGATFDSLGVVASGGTNGFAGYVKVADDTWVAAVDQSGATDHEIFATDSGGAVWAIDETQTATSTIPDATVSGFTITNTTTGAELDDLIQMVDTALEDMTSAAADLGSLGMRIDLQEEFVSKLTESIDKGIGRLVDADMNEESTRLKALQTQQQLGIQSLSIANSASESILTLFR
ncbi:MULTISPECIES: flagellin N-terminal helical domain-containing protein [unclassified Shinella]|jgi:flagellin|uniref:flagellin N-terminal helical domain-containing protein n=1 Tax=unclassified Shinella TaxID=2643062 RepID=UPI000437ACC3|nr:MULTISPECIES: flagellin [unclassified Shinella]MCA0341090.1 flagellin [Pseudomonadota bacterium]EYR82004.1 flagellin D [Shinella sp. DD12]KNY14841.1 flagellin [Shinella sp. SUS2]KOC74494.1 flagellin [Shinella sp. GWS1]MCO5152772.1 flagellin [Shinella sp.]